MAFPPALDVARERWHEMARRMGFPDPDGLNANDRRGLARRFPELSTRIAILPEDPFRSDLEFNKELWDWWAKERDAPFGGALRWNRCLPTADAAVQVDGHGDRWGACLALHRHGGIESLSDDVFSPGDDPAYTGWYGPLRYYGSPLMHRPGCCSTWK